MTKKPLVIIFLTVFIDLVGFGMIIPLSPYLAQTHGADAATVGLLMASYSFFQFLFAPVWGRLSDRWGRRPIIIGSLVGAAFSHLLFAFAGNLPTMFLARSLAGLFGANISTAIAFIADVTDEKNRSKGMGLIGAAFGMGFVLGPAIGGVLADWGRGFSLSPPFGDQTAALAASLICALNALFAWRFLPESLVPQARARASRSNRWHRLASLLSLTTPVGRLLIAYFLASLAMANMEAPLFLLVAQRFSWSQSQASYGFAYVGVMMILTQGGLLRWVVPRFGERKTLMLGGALFAVGLIGIGLATTVAFLALAVTSLAVGNGLFNPALTGSVSLATARTAQGEVLGVNQSLSALGRIIGPVTGGWLFDHLGMSSPFLFGGLLVGLSLILVLPKR